jgi:AbrB family looped-hinge helix DNA binding protein
MVGIGAIAMAKEVVVTRRGQTTIPTSIRKKLGIEEGTRLMVDTEGNKVVLTKIPSIFDLAGKSRLTTKEAYRLLDDMRASEG